MLRRHFWIWLVIVAPTQAAAKPPVTTTATEFPSELVHWAPVEGDPVFAGAGPGHWDAAIRERGWILHEGDTYYLCYTGYHGLSEGIKQLGCATSPDGLYWTRVGENPLCAGHWIEDMMVLPHDGTYFMFAEGPKQSVSQLLTSQDRLHWKVAGVLDIRCADGRRVDPPYGTPTVWVENGIWYLFYERADLGVWLATTRDPHSLRWTNVQDEPVLALGPGEYDREQIALDQVFRHRGSYYALYHGSGRRNGESPRTWSTNIARSSDLIHWQKYSGNPIVDHNKSSGIFVPTAAGYRLYTMHGQVDVFESSHK